MARSLVIVESPAKAKTINKDLGKNYHVKASVGHVLDLPKKTIGIRLPDEEDVPQKKKRSKKRKKGAKPQPVRKPVTLDDGKIFEPTLQIISGKGKVINDLRKAANNAAAVYLAGDPDREGEAISAHLAMVLAKPQKFEEQEPSAPRFGRKPKPVDPAEEEEKKKAAKEIPATDPKKIFRVTFNEITPKAIRAAFDHPRAVDQNLVDAQQARRVLDRIVGYKVSPLLWDKVRRGLSAGRVQTVAVRLVVEREREIQAFVKTEYWSIVANLSAQLPPAFDARLYKIADKTVKTAGFDEGVKKSEVHIKDQGEAQQILAELKGATYTVAEVSTKEKKRNPVPPFITSKLQQEASRKLRFSAKR